MSLVVILGGGFAGLACARTLRAEIGEGHRIVLVDPSPRFVVGAAKTWVMLGQCTSEEASAPRARLLPPGVEWLRAEVESIDPATRAVRAGGSVLAPDVLVLALGVALDPGAIPGLAEAAHTFYTLEGAAKLRSALESFRGGRLLVVVPSVPFQCPPAPYEAAFLLHGWLEARGLRGSTEFELWTAEKAPMTTAGPEMGSLMRGELTSRGIGFHPQMKIASVDAARRLLRLDEGTEVRYDLLIAIPPHRAPRPVVDAGLAEPSGWVPVHAETLEVKSPGAAARIYAIGDVTGLGLPGRYDPAVPLSLPKAGVFAAAEGTVVGHRIAAELQGRAPDAVFDGRGFCFVETGGERAMRAEGSFFDKPHPVMSARPPDAAQYRDKADWVRGWLSEPTA